VDAVVGQPDAEEDDGRVEDLGEVGLGAAAALAREQGASAEPFLDRAVAPPRTGGRTGEPRPYDAAMNASPRDLVSGPDRHEAHADLGHRHGGMTVFAPSPVKPPSMPLTSKVGRAHTRSSVE
jgi:hypothetical protein